MAKNNWEKMLFKAIAALIKSILSLLAGQKVQPKKSGRSAGASNSKPGAIRQTGRTFREVVGESNYRQALSDIAGGVALPGLGLEVVATLVCENANPYDENAVRVGIDGRTVGYLSREDAAAYRRRLAKSGLAQAPQQVNARVAGGGKGKNYGVYLDLPDRLV